LQKVLWCAHTVGVDVFVLVPQQAAQSLTSTQQKAHAAPPTASNTATTAAMLEQQQQHRDARTPTVSSPRAPQSTPARTGALTNMDLPESDASFLRVAPAGGVQQRPQTTERREVGQPAEDQLSAFPAHSLLLHSSDTQVGLQSRLSFVVQFHCVMWV
jgi:hypothetical protein